MPRLLKNFHDDYHFFLRILYVDATILSNVAIVQLFMWIYMATLTLEARPGIRRQRAPYLLVSLVLLLLSCVIAAARASVSYRLTLSAPPYWSAAPGEWAALIDKIYNNLLSRVDSLVGNLIYLIGDALMLYRCYILLGDRYWIVALSTLLFLACLVVDLKLSADAFKGFDMTEPGFNELWVATTWLHLALSAVITASIAIHLHRAHSRMAKLLPMDRNEDYIGVINILVESAAPIVVFAIGTLVPLYFFDSNHYTAWRTHIIFQLGYNVSVLLAPQLIIFRVAIGRSWADKRDASRTTHSAAIEFAAIPEARSSTVLRDPA